MLKIGNGNDDDERLRNFLIFKFYGTDKELDESSPIFGIVILLGIIGLLIWLVIS
jgi:hypothetical protein